MSGQVPEPTAHRRLLFRGLAVTGFALAGSVLFGMGTAAADDSAEPSMADDNGSPALLSDTVGALGDLLLDPAGDDTEAPDGGILDVGGSLLDVDTTDLGLDTLAGARVVSDALAIGEATADDADDNVSTGKARPESRNEVGPNDSERSRGPAGGGATRTSTEAGAEHSSEARESDRGGLDEVAPTTESVRAEATRLRSAGGELDGALRGALSTLDPAVDAVAALTAPVVAAVEPALSPVVSTVQPVLAPLDPVLAPVVATVEPVTSSVVAVASPVLAGLAPVTATVEPVVSVVLPVTDVVAPVGGVVDGLAGAPRLQSGTSAVQLPIAAEPATTAPVSSHHLEITALEATESAFTSADAGLRHHAIRGHSAAPMNSSAAAGEPELTADRAGGDRPMPLPALTGLPGLSVGALSAAASADQPVPSSSALLPEEAVRHARFASAAARAKGFDGQAQREANRPSVSPD